MTSSHLLAKSTPYDVTSTRLERPAPSTHVADRPTWRAVADAISGFALLGVIAWGMWHMAIHLTYLTPQLAAAWDQYPL